MTPTWPSTGTVTGWKRPSAIGSKSTWTIGLYGAMPVWFENDAPNTSSRSDSFISQLATGVPLRPSTPAPSGWRSDTWPLALNVVSTGASKRLGEREHRRHVEAHAVADDDHRPPRAVDQRERVVDRRRRRRDVVVGHAPDG